MTTVYLDMDGVVADWDRRATEILGKPQPVNLAGVIEDRWPQEDWDNLRTRSRFYLDLPKMPQADRMVNLARNLRDTMDYTVLFLTAIPKNNDMPWAIYDKVLWVQENYPDIAVHFGPYSQDKHVHCTPGDILVDDRRDNCVAWEEAGGAAIYVTKDYNLALKQFQDLVESRKALGR